MSISSRSLSISICVPAFNEESTLKGAVEDLLQVISPAVNKLEIIIVNDGSRDATTIITEELAKKYPQIKVIYHSKNLGIGTSYRDALSVAQGEYFTWFPGDHENSAAEFLQCLAFLQKDVIVTCYHGWLDPRPLSRRLISRIYNRLLSIYFGVNLKYFNGLTVFSTHVLRSFPLVSKGFVLFAETMIRAKALGCKVIELPAPLKKRIAGHSKALTLFSFFQVLKDLLRICWISQTSKTINTIFLLTGIVSILFLPLVLGLGGIFHDDLAMEVFLRHYFVAGNLKQGIIPLWDPHIWCGALPFYARYYADTYYLPLWPFLMLANLKDVTQSYWVISVLPLWLHYILGAIGFYVLLKKVVKCGYFSSSLGALAYVYSPTLIYSYVWIKTVIMQAWLPWLIVVYAWAVQKWRIWKIVLASAILALIITAGSPNYLPFVMFIWLCVIIMLILFRRHSHEKNAVIAPLAIAFAISILACCMSAVYLFSFFDGLSFTRMHFELTAEAAFLRTDRNLPVVYLATLFLPNLFGNITGSNFIGEPVSFWEANMCATVVLTLLVILALVLSFKKLKTGPLGLAALGCVVLYVFGILCALGGNTPFYRYVIGGLPGIGGLPHPVRYRMIQCFAASVLAAIGLERVINISPGINNARLKFWAWFYISASCIAVGAALLYPQSNIYKDSWVGKPFAYSDTFLAIRQPAGVYSPKDSRIKKIGAMFSAESEGQVRYADSDNALPWAGVLAVNYSVPSGGWFEFNVDIPPNKFIWIYPRSGQGAIGLNYVNVQTPSFNYDGKWIIHTHQKTVCMYQGSQPLKASILQRLTRAGIDKTAFYPVILYWIITLLLIILGVYLLKPRVFGLLLGSVAVIELVLLGMLAFYAGRFTLDVMRPSHIRTLNPSKHPMLQQMTGSVSRAAVDHNLRIATNQPYYDNFLQLGKRYAFMGYEMHPLESRFKHAIETAYGQPMDWPIYDETNILPVNKFFLSNFSVGYLMSDNLKSIFPQGSIIELPENKGFFVHVNPEALPRIYTMDNVIVAKDDEQCRQLVSADLRRAVYVSPGTPIPPGSNIPVPHFLSFDDLQKKNSIRRVDFDNPNRVDVEIEVNIPSVLVFTEVWYPGWNALVDGKHAQIFRVNYCQRGVWLDKGKHLVRLYFLPQAWKRGGFISMISLGVVFVLLSFSFVNKFLPRREKR